MAIPCSGQMVAMKTVKCNEPRVAYQVSQAPDANHWPHIGSLLFTLTACTDEKHTPQGARQERPWLRGKYLGVSATGSHSNYSFEYPEGNLLLTTSKNPEF